MVCAGLWVVRRRRPLNSEEIFTFMALLVWIAGDIVIGMNFAEDDNAKRWAVRMLLFMILASQYLVLRSRGGSDVEVMEVEETLVIERERERDKI